MGNTDDLKKSEKRKLKCLCLFGRGISAFEASEAVMLIWTDEKRNDAAMRIVKLLLEERGIYGDKGRRWI